MRAARFATAIAAVGLAVLMSIVLVPTLPSSPGSSASVGAVQPDFHIVPNRFPIQHIVYVVLENHAYDNYFGVYCQQASRICPNTGNGIPPGTCVNIIPGTSSGGCIKPFALNQSYVNSSLGGAHNWGASHKSYDNGLMDGFYASAPHIRQVMGYYNGTTIPTYWNLAEQFGLGDNFFSSALSYSLPNHWYVIAGQAPNASEAPASGAFTRPGFAAPLSGGEEIYLNQSNTTEALDDELVNSSVSWNYFDAATRNATYLQALNRTDSGNISQPSVFDYWDPFLSKNETYTAQFASHFVSRENFFNDTVNGTLPNVSWIIPANTESDHPPDNLNNGMAFVTSIASAVENSSALWNNTAIFVTWDEYGGYYDHVPPPQIDGDGLGFRVPLLVISAYTPEGYISHVMSQFESPLHFMEWRFGLSNITYRDAQASLPLDYFDLNATPRAPDPVPAGAPYPQVQQSQALRRVAHLAVTTNATQANLSWNEAHGTAPVAGFLVRYGTGRPLASEVLPRTQNQTTIGGLTCNTTYVFQVLTFAGGNRSPVATIVLSTGACGPMGAPIGGSPATVAALGGKARYAGAFPLGEARVVAAPARATPAPVGPAASTFAAAPGTGPWSP